MGWTEECFVEIEIPNNVHHVSDDGITDSEGSRRANI